MWCSWSTVQNYGWLKHHDFASDCSLVCLFVAAPGGGSRPGAGTKQTNKKVGPSSLKSAHPCINSCLKGGCWSQKLSASWILVRKVGNFSSSSIFLEGGLSVPKIRARKGLSRHLYRPQSVWHRASDDPAPPLWEKRGMVKALPGSQTKCSLFYYVICLFTLSFLPINSLCYTWLIANLTSHFVISGPSIQWTLWQNGDLNPGIPNPTH